MGCATMADQSVLPLEGLVAKEAAVRFPVLVVEDHVPLHDKVVAEHFVANRALRRSEPFFRSR